MSDRTTPIAQEVGERVIPLQRTFLVADEYAEELLRDWSRPVQLRMVQLPSGRLELHARRVDE